MSGLQRDGRYAWVFLAVTALVSFIFMGLIDSTGIVVAVLIAHYNESNAKGGWVGSIIFFLILGLSPVVVYIYNRIGFRWCLLISSIFYSLSFVITPFVPNINLIFITYSIPFGISMSCISNLIIITQEEYFSEYFGFSIGVRFGAAILGGVVVSQTLPYVFDGLGVKHTFLSLLAFLPVILCYGLAPRHKVTNVRSCTSIAATKKLYLEFLRDRSFTLSLAGVALYLLASMVLTILMVRYGMTLGLSLSKAKLFLVVKGSAGLVGTIIAGRITDRALRNGFVKLACQILYGAFALLCLLCSLIPNSFSFILVYMAFMGLIDGIWWAMYPVLIVDITSGYHTKEAYGLVGLVAAVARLPGPPFLGWLFDITGDFRYVFYVLFVIGIMATVLLGISSYVKVEKQLSLAEKNSTRKTEPECCDDGAGLSTAFIILETAV